jgi:hypothetical protein
MAYSNSIAPYVGLRPFEESESFLFFGRDRDVKQLLNHVYSSQILVVFAPSGVGKTSLLRAGVIPELRKDPRLEVFYFFDWKVDSLTQIRKQLRESIGSDAQPAADEQASFLELLRMFRDKLQRRCVLIFDQFEEVERYQDGLDQIWDVLAPIGNVLDAPARLILTLREDYLGILDGLMDRVPGLLDNRFREGSWMSRELRGLSKDPSLKPSRHTWRKKLWSK